MTTLGTEEEHRQYEVFFNPDESPLTSARVSYWRTSRSGRSAWAFPSPKGQSDVFRYWYNSVAEAKAACAMHALTDTFPPAVKMEGFPDEHEAHTVG